MGIEFPFNPDWSARVTTEESFKTEIFASRDQTEQRRALRLNPRRSISFRVAEARERSRRFRSFMETYLQAEVEVLDPTRSAVLALAATGTDTTVTLGSMPSWAAAGAKVYFKDGESRVFRTLDSVSGAELSLTSQISSTFAAGSKMYPALTGRFEQSMSQTRVTSHVALGDVTLLVDPSDEVLQSGAAAETYNGDELYLKKPNWAGAPQIRIGGFLETADADHGVKSHYGYLNWNDRTLQLGFMAKNRSEVEDVQAFFRRHKGRRGAFYMPTWEPDLPLITGVVGDALVIPGTEFYQQYNATDTYNHVIALYRDGTHEAKQVLSITTDGADTTVTFASAWAKAPTAETAFKLCWLLRQRLASDTLELEWSTDSVAQWSANFKILREAA